MSESEEHRSLVFGVRDALIALYPGSEAVIDVPRFPGDRVPPRIGGYRPDLFISDEKATVIAEAKTDKDVDRRRTYEQVIAFIDYLEQSKNGLFALSVSGRRADLAKTTLRFICREIEPSRRTRLAVFDECDLWLLDRRGFTWAILEPS